MVPFPFSSNLFFWNILIYVCWIFTVYHTYFLNSFIVCYVIFLCCIFFVIYSRNIFQFTNSCFDYIHSGIFSIIFFPGNLIDYFLMPLTLSAYLYFLINCIDVTFLLCLFKTTNMVFTKIWNWSIIFMSSGMTALTNFLKFFWQAFYMILHVLEFWFSVSTWMRGIFKNSLSLSLLPLPLLGS